MPSPFTQDIEDVPLPGDGNQSTVAMHSFKVEKHYEPRGEWTLHRLDSTTQFLCGQCKKRKKAKLVATRQSSWEDLCCNACYGQFLLTERWSLQQVQYYAHPRRCEDCNDRRVVYWIMSRQTWPMYVSMETAPSCYLDGRRQYIHALRRTSLG